MLRRILGGPRGPPALPPRPASRSAADQHPPDLARERSKTVTSFYNQPAIDAAAEKVGDGGGIWGGFGVLGGFLWDLGWIWGGFGVFWGFSMGFGVDLGCFGGFLWDLGWIWAVLGVFYGIWGGFGLFWGPFGSCHPADIAVSQPSVRLTPTTMLYSGRSQDGSHILVSWGGAGGALGTWGLWDPGGFGVPGGFVVTKVLAEQIQVLLGTRWLWDPGGFGVPDGFGVTKVLAEQIQVGLGTRWLWD